MGFDWGLAMVAWWPMIGAGNQPCKRVSCKALECHIIPMRTLFGPWGPFKALKGVIKALEALIGHSRAL